MAKFKVVKSSGVTEDYSADKLKRSLELSGLKPQEFEEIISNVEANLNHERDSTENIFKKTRDIVYKKSHLAGLKYSLKAAILDLGPTGYIFERFIAKALEHQGYKTQVSVIMKGRCVNHEVDIYAKNHHHIFFGECKFHNAHYIKNDMKTALYVKARMDDLRENKDNVFDEFYLISNTAFSSDAIQYAACTGLKLIGYNSPKGKNLYDLIEENHLYPITILSGLKKSDVKYLLEKGIIICKDLCNQISELETLGYSALEAENILCNFKRISNWSCP